MIADSRHRIGRELLTFLPIHFLLAFALELFLKAWLEDAGLLRTALGKAPYGHSLRRLHAEYRARELPDINELQALVDHLHPAHSAFEYRYMKLTGTYADTNLDVAFHLLDQLDIEIGASRGNAT